MKGPPKSILQLTNRYRHRKTTPLLPALPWVVLGVTALQRHLPEENFHLRVNSTSKYHGNLRNNDGLHNFGVAPLPVTVPNEDL